MRCVSRLAARSLVLATAAIGTDPVTVFFELLVDGFLFFRAFFFSWNSSKLRDGRASIFSSKLKSLQDRPKDRHVRFEHLCCEHPGQVSSTLDLVSCHLTFKPYPRDRPLTFMFKIWDISCSNLIPENGHWNTHTHTHTSWPMTESQVD